MELLKEETVIFPPARCYNAGLSQNQLNSTDSFHEQPLNTESTKL